MERILPPIAFQRIGYRPRQQFAPAFAQQRAVRLISAEHLRGKIAATSARDRRLVLANHAVADLARQLLLYSLRP
jgi:hypothetical protein